MFTNYYDDIYQFKLENIDDLSELFEILNKDSIVINDPIGIQEIYKKYPDYCNTIKPPARLGVYKSFSGVIMKNLHVIIYLRLPTANKITRRNDK